MAKRTSLSESHKRNIQKAVQANWDKRKGKESSVSPRMVLARILVAIVEVEQLDSERRGPKGYDDEFDQGRYAASTTILTALRTKCAELGIDLRPADNDAEGGCQ